jgi:G3E family GTPase
VAEVPELTPVNVVTGFLGSGKTTLIARLLADPALADTAVLVNEFGEVGLDHHLLERIDETMVLLKSGCLCCTVRGELAEAIRGLHSKRARGLVPPFGRLVVETSGLAEPFPILATVRGDPVLRHHFRIGNVVTAVDAVTGAASLDRHPESVKQAAAADRIVLTKTDIAATEAAAGLVRRLGALNPSAPIVRAAEESLDPDALLVRDGGGLPERALPAGAWLAEPAEGDRHVDGVRSFAVTVDAPLDWTAFGVWLTMLLNRHGERVLRVKAILNVAGEAAPVAVHGVQHLVHPPVHMRAWPDGDRRSRMVFIVDGLDPALVRRSLAAMLRLAAPAAA